MNILAELISVRNREDVLILNATNREIVNVEEAIKAAENCDTIEIQYLKYNQDKNNVTVIRTLGDFD